MPKVLNKRTAGKEELANAVYVGRPSAFGNPYSHIKNAAVNWQYRTRTRDESIELYLKHLDENPHLVDKIKRELRGKDLVCHCAPLPCHADTLLRIANE